MINHSQFCFRGILWFSHKIAPYSVGCPTFGVQSMRLRGPTKRESNLLPRRFSSSLASDAKSLLIEQAFRIWSVIEDDSPLRGSPCGPLLTQRSLASLESNLLPRRFSSSLASDAKSLLIEQAFRIWSVIEDSNLRPLRPERSALPGCANHRMRGASYCWDAYPSMPYFQKSLNRRETQQPEQRIAGCSTFLAAVDLKRFAILGYLTCHRLAEIGCARRGECKLSQ